MKKILIVGAGISGLYLANLLERNGNFDYRIIERKSKINLFDGYGIQISVNGIKLLNEIGFKETKAQEVFFPKHIKFYNSKNCRLITNIEISKFNDNGNYYTTLKRSTLMNFLSAKIPKQKIIFKTNIDDIGYSKKLQIKLNGDLLEFDYLALCDGVFSENKNKVIKNNRNAQFNNSLAFRGTLKNFEQKDISVYLGPNLHFVIYPLNQEGDYNFISVIRENNIKKIDNKITSIENYFKFIKSNTSLDLRKLENKSVYPIFVSKHYNKPHNEKIFIVGDALFAFPPSFAQGASQSLETSHEAYKNIIGEKNNYYENRELIIKEVKVRSEFNQFAFHVSNPFIKYFRDISMKLLCNKKFFLKYYLGRIYK